MERIKLDCEISINFLLDELVSGVRRSTENTYEVIITTASNKEYILETFCNKLDSLIGRKIKTIKLNEKDMRRYEGQVAWIDTRIQTEDDLAVQLTCNMQTFYYANF